MNNKIITISKKTTTIYACICVFAMLFLQHPAKASDERYEIYNQGINTGITSYMQYYVLNVNEPFIYIHIKDVYKLGLRVEDIENGIALSSSEKKANIFFDSSVKIDEYTFEEPLFRMGEHSWIMLDVIGKCFSSEYSGELVGEVERIYLNTGEKAAKHEPGSIDVNLCVFNFQNNIYSIQLQNQSYCSIENVKIFTAYYAKDGSLIDVDTSNVYSMEGKDVITTFVPLNDYFDNAGEIKIMLWDGENIPLVNAIIPKSFQLQFKNMPPENPEDREIIFSDVMVDNKYYDAIYTIHNNFQDIGLSFVYEDGTFKPKNNVMRNKFAYDLNRLIGNNFTDVDVDCNMADVSQTNWCKNDVGYLVSKEIMSLQDGYFYPFENITLYDSLSAFLRVLGEDNFTTENIPDLAMKYNLLDNIEVQDGVITREIYAQLLYNFAKEYIRPGI